MRSLRTQCIQNGIFAWASAWKICGMPTKMVARLEIISRIAALNGWRDLISTMPAPIDSGVKMQTVSMKL